MLFVTEKTNTKNIQKEQIVSEWNHDGKQERQKCMY